MGYLELDSVNYKYAYVINLPNPRFFMKISTNISKSGVVHHSYLIGSEINFDKLTNHKLQFSAVVGVKTRLNLFSHNLIVCHI